MIQDEITLERIKTAHPFIREALGCIYEEICKTVNTEKSQIRFSSVLRTFEEQNELYKKGRSKPGNKVTWVKGGYSYHNYGLAVDIVLLIDKDGNKSFETASWDTTFDGDNDSIADWLEVAKIFNSYGWQWGLYSRTGKHYDLPHFQRTFGYKASELKRMNKDNEGYPILP